MDDENQLMKHLFGMLFGSVQNRYAKEWMRIGDILKTEEIKDEFKNNQLIIDINTLLVDYLQKHAADQYKINEDGELGWKCPVCPDFHLVKERKFRVNLMDALVTIISGYVDKE